MSSEQCLVNDDRIVNNHKHHQSTAVKVAFPRVAKEESKSVPIEALQHHSGARLNRTIIVIVAKRLTPSALYTLPHCHIWKVAGSPGVLFPSLQMGQNVLITQEDDWMVVE